MVRNTEFSAQECGDGLSGVWQREAHGLSVWTKGGGSGRQPGIVNRTDKRVFVEM